MNTVGFFMFLALYLLNSGNAKEYSVHCEDVQIPTLTYD